MSNDLRQEIVALLPRLRRFAYSLAGNQDEADDLVQAACERALARLDQFAPGSRLDSWMFRIVQTVWIDRLRYGRRWRKVSDPVVMESIPHDARIHERTEAAHALALVRSAIAALPEEQRLVVALVAVEGMSYQEAADTLGVPVGTVMSRLARARMKIGAAVADKPKVAKTKGAPT
ncbi:MAG: RNA polymerase sigma factor [Hyphomicrobiales bacterium]|nr:RNA polymerase sigma factor [Hyphomicrobiales bacterium]